MKEMTAFGGWRNLAAAMASKPVKAYVKPAQWLVMCG